MAAFKVLLWCVLAHFCPALGRDSNCPGGKCGKKTDHVLLQRKASSPALDRARCAPRAFLTLGYGNFHLGQCEGDCNHDDDCSGSLRCMQRSGNEDVPGCNGLPFWGVDYCYDPACEPGNDPLPSLPQPSPPNEASSTTSAPPIQQDPMIIAPPLDSSYGQHGSQNMPKCAGDCDTDSQCAQGLSCFQRDGTSPVPGCFGGGVPNFDYCYDPNDVTDSPTTPTTTNIPSGTFPPLDSSYGQHGSQNMPKCAGDCDTDSQCAQGLSCFQRDGTSPVPGCWGTGEPNFDYCYDPNDASTPSTTTATTTSMPAGTFPPLDSSYGQHGSQNMPKCAGDCDTDSQCAQGLSCFQRDGTSPVPGCLGTGEPNFDYCYDPNDASTPSTGDACLCVFDIDRTLTGAQGTAGGACPSNLEIQGVRDDAYWPAYPGWLTISDLGQKLQETFCNECFLGIVSAGYASGDNSAERAYLLDHVLVSRPFTELRAREPRAASWSRRRFESPLVLGWADTKKQDAVEHILQWYQAQDIRVPPSRTHFFGDRTENIGPFSAKGFNAREISCASRDLSIHNGMVGYCGGTAAEVVDTPGVALCNSPGPSPSPAPSPTGGSCLCVFDIDRTLTGAQGVAGPGSTCPGNKVINNVWDSAYSQGWLTLSEAAQKLQQTFCNECFLGIVSHGDASGHGSPERDFILKNVLNSVPFRRLKREQPEASVWSSHTVSSPLVLRWPDKLKQDAVSGIVRWYGQKGVTIAPEKVHFFGDRTENIGPFGASGFNSREISCASRDYNIGNGMVGYCGATLDEIVDTPGVSTCNAN